MKVLISFTKINVFRKLSPNSWLSVPNIRISLFFFLLSFIFEASPAVMEIPLH